MNQFTTITPQQAREKMNSGALLLDVREYPEWCDCHVEGARLLPLGELQGKPGAVEPGREILLLCRSGRHAREAAQSLPVETTVSVVEGGIEAWKSAGLPTKRAPRGPISLERQVRIGAGALVLLGLLVPRVQFLAYFVPCGLIFAGITDFCGMAKVLARAPWNRPRDS